MACAAASSRDHNDLLIHEEAVMTTEDHLPTAHAGPQTGRLRRWMRSVLTSRPKAGGGPPPR
jgi:hypothetical protein